MHDKNLSAIATVCVKGDTYTQHMSPITQRNRAEEQNDARN